MQLTRDQTFNVVLHIRTPVSADNVKVGTGMFLIKGNELYLLTATHVAVTTNAATEIVVSDSVGNSQTIPIKQFSRLLDWKHHPIADLSALQLFPRPSILPLLKNRFFPFEQLNLNNPPPSRDAYLTCVGFPRGLGATGKFSPFTFRSHAASSLITLLRADTNTPSDFFALENPSVGGYSGGPVFELGYVELGAATSFIGPTICHGIMHGTISDDTGGKIAMVTPCSYVVNIIK